jgi:hypothetical protein
MAEYGNFSFETCEPPVVTTEFGEIHIDLPIVGVGKDDTRQCLLKWTPFSGPGTALYKVEGERPAETPHRSQRGRLNRLHALNQNR